MCDGNTEAKSSKFYNPERKQNFLDTISADRRYMFLALFEKMTPQIEGLYGKDVCDFTYNEAYDLISGVIPALSRRKLEYVNCLVRYTDWCMANGYAFDNPYSRIDVDNAYSMDSIRELYVRDAAMLEDRMNEILYPLEENSADLLCRCSLWLTWIGLPSDALDKIQKTDVTDTEIVWNGKVYPIPEEAMEAIATMKATEEFTKRGTVRMQDPSKLMSLTERSNGTTFQKKMATELACKKNRRGAKSHLSFTRVQYAGIFYRMLQDERAGKDVFGENSLFYRKFETNQKKNENLYRLWKEAYYEE